MVKNSINASYYDDFDDPFAPSDDSNINVPAHDDWNGLPWTEEPYDYDNPFDHNKDYNAEVLPVESMPDITPEEREICEVLYRNSSNNRDTAADNDTSSTDVKDDVDIDDDMTLFDDNPSSRLSRHTPHFNPIFRLSERFSLTAPHRTGRAVFPHPALQQKIRISMRFSDRL